jgi:hypothetical protein
MPKTGRIASGGRQQSSNALIGAAIVFLVPGLLYWSIHGFNFEFNDWFYLGGFALFISMAVWARWSPLVPTLIGAAFYILFLALQVRDIANWRLITWIIHAAITVLFAIAIVAALRRDVTQTPASS